MDPVSDMFIRIKNAQRAGHETVQIPYSRLKHEIAKTIARAGLIGEIERRGKRVRKLLEITLRYRDDEPAVHDVILLSKQSRRLYAPYHALRSAKHGGVIILSTSKGVMTSLEAKKEKVGGEIIAEIW